MYIFAMILLWAWLPIVVAIFGFRPPREAVLFSFLTAWMFLPTLQFDLPGMPDYTKMTASTLGVFASVLLFDVGRLVAFRPRWFDLPMLIFCTSPMVSALTNNQGGYDGFSAVMEQVSAWGIPYLIGRLYLGDAEGMRRLALGIAMTGILYIPFCLIEIRLSPIFDRVVYGIVKWEGERWGTFRPHVFLSGGLELGMWMTCASLAAVSLWASGSVKRLWNMPFGMLTLALVTTTFLVRATGAFLLLLIGLLFIRLARLTKSSWPAWVLVLIPPTYFATRMSGFWSGSNLVAITEALTDADRTQSIKFRFQQEEVMMRSAWRRPTFGWARAGGFNMTESGKREAVSDGYWIITLGNAGLVGLLSLWSMLCLPLALATFRFPARTWNDPDVAPSVAMAVLLSLFMIDNISNAMPNPLYALIMGGAIALPNLSRMRRRGGPDPSLAEGRELLALGRPEQAALQFRHFLEHGAESGPGPGDPTALGERIEALEGLSGSLLGSGRFDEAEPIFRDLVACRQVVASEDRDPGLICSLAGAHEGLARTLARLGRHDRAIEERLKAVDLRSGLVAAYPGDPSEVRRRAASLNDLAWLLATDAPPRLQDPIRAAELAAEAARTAPEDPAGWNTLGVARYRSGDFPGCVDALGRSVDLGATGGTAFDHYFLAMACCQLGELDQASVWFGRAVAWSNRNGSDHAGLVGFRREATAVLARSGLAHPTLRA